MSLNAKYGFCFLSFRTCSGVSLELKSDDDIILSGSNPITEYLDILPSSPKDSKIKHVSNTLSIFWKSEYTSMSSASFIYTGFFGKDIFFIFFIKKRPYKNLSTLRFLQGRVTVVPPYFVA